MSDVTKAKALEKLAKMAVKIGYPDKWRDYSKLEITPDSYVMNVFRSSKFDFEFELAKIGKPVDRGEWHMTPQTVNAYYNPNMNEIVFPAAILQPPFFNMNADDAVNYGGIGVVIGHEMTHGFDDQGRQYDKDGNLADWWTEEDAKNFDAKVGVIVAEADKYTELDSLHISGKLTLGENIADFGGLTISLAALKNASNNKLDAPMLDGFTPLQRYFISFAQIWRQNVRDKELQRRLKEDVHSPGDYRVNGSLPNVPEFYTAFGIKAGDKLYIAPENRAQIW
jgi:putative endopeptidase